MIPRHLSALEAQRLQENEPVAQFEIGNHRNFVYLLLDWSSRKAAIVDPQYDLSEPLSALTQFGFELEHILLTHTHSDHTGGVRPLFERFPGITLHVHPGDAKRLKNPMGQDRRIELTQDEQIIRVGNMEVQALHTPGHSAGELCYRTPPYLLTGDTVFIRDCGRTDLDTGSNEQMFQSLRRIAALPLETIILPGHHYAPECASTLKKELEESPPFQCRSTEELASLP